MNAQEVLEIGQDLIYTVLLLALPTLVVSLVVGLVFSVLQTITSIQEQTLTFVPRLIAVGLVLILTMSWSLKLAVHFTVRMLGHAAEVVQ
ncbi:MAG TPA: flagellar biosynthetic protein FliQ [Gemmataceae bacterium]|nr:flagellar biosynthetic protein FliQ [Gemmataceae bacterium]